jgi:hypothetical protein
MGSIDKAGEFKRQGPDGKLGSDGSEGRAVWEPGSKARQGVGRQ